MVIYFTNCFPFKTTSIGFISDRDSPARVLMISLAHLGKHRSAAPLVTKMEWHRR